MSSLLSIVNHAIITQLVEESRHNYGFYPSEASISFINEFGENEVVGDCHRKSYWKRAGEKATNTISAPAQRKMDFGNYLHDLEVNYYKKARIYVADEVRFWNKEKQVSGRVDAFVMLDGNLVGVEIKSIYEYYGRMGVIDCPRGVVFAPKKEHVMQVMLYLDYFKEVSLFKISYIDRGSAASAEHDIRLNSDGCPVVNGKTWEWLTLAGIYERFAVLKQYLTDKTLPPCDYCLVYPKERLQVLYETGRLNKTQMVQFEKGLVVMSGKNKMGDWQSSYCPYKNKCQKFIENPGG